MSWNLFKIWGWDTVTFQALICTNCITDIHPIPQYSSARGRLVPCGTKSVSLPYETKQWVGAGPVYGYTAGLTRFRAIEWLSAQLRVLKQCCFINITGENGAFDYEKWNCEVISNLWILVSRQIMSCLKRDSRVIVNRKNKFQNEELSKAESDSSVAVFLGK